MAKCPLFVAAGKEKDECIREQCAWFRLSQARTSDLAGNARPNGECAIMRVGKTPPLPRR